MGGLHLPRALDGPDHGLRFIERFLVLQFGHGVGDNARAGLHVALAADGADEYMERYAVPVLAEIDTRALVRHLRDRGVMRGVISTTEIDPGVLVEKAEKHSAKWRVPSLAPCVSTKTSYEFDASDPRSQMGEPLLAEGFIQTAERNQKAQANKRILHVVAYDFGIKQNILRHVNARWLPRHSGPETAAEDVLSLKPDGVFLSNGPDYPEPVDYAVRAIRNMMGRVPVFGICLGHQLCGLALGGRTYKLKFGHHLRQSSGAQQHHRQGRDHRPQP